MLIQCDRGIFFSQARKAESANCSPGGQPGRVQAQEAICGGFCVGGVCWAPRPPAPFGLSDISILLIVTAC